MKFKPMSLAFKYCVGRGLELGLLPTTLLIFLIAGLWRLAMVLMACIPRTWWITAITRSSS